MRHSVIVLLFIAILAFFFMVIIFTSRKITEPTNTQSPAETMTTGQKNTNAISITGTFVTQPSSGVYCSPEDIQAVLTLSPGAGNVYGTFTIKNFTKVSCLIQGGQFITPDYDSQSVKNISVSYIGHTQPVPFVLPPGQSLYSQVHYPNGPQCQSIGFNQTPVSFSYKISSTDTVLFKTGEGKTQLVIQTCKTNSAITEIKIWNLSSQPITPQHS